MSILKFNAIISYEDMHKIFMNEDASNIINALSNKYIEEFLTGRAKLELDVFSDNFIKQNNNIFLIDELSVEIRERYYERKLTDKDILDNIIFVLPPNHYILYKIVLNNFLIFYLLYLIPLWK